MTRYFTDDHAVWKFEPGKHPMTRDVEDSEWEHSAFPGIESFLKSPGETREISEGEGEPS